MGFLKSFEIEVLQALGGRTLSAPQVVKLSEDGELVSLDFSGVGYPLTLRHRDLPDARVVLDKPIVTGKADDLLTGFAAFVENGEVTLECFSYGGEPVPEDYRNFDVRVIE